MPLLSEIATTATRTPVYELSTDLPEGTRFNLILTDRFDGGEYSIGIKLTRNGSANSSQYALVVEVDRLQLPEDILWEWVAAMKRAKLFPKNRSGISALRLLKGVCHITLRGHLSTGGTTWQFTQGESLGPLIFCAPGVADRRYETRPFLEERISSLRLLRVEQR